MKTCLHHIFVSNAVLIFPYFEKHKFKRRWKTIPQWNTTLENIFPLWYNAWHYLVCSFKVSLLIIRGTQKPVACHELACTIEDLSKHNWFVAGGGGLASPLIFTLKCCSKQTWARNVWRTSHHYCHCPRPLSYMINDFRLCDSLKGVSQLVTRYRFLCASSNELLASQVGPLCMR